MRTSHTDCYLLPPSPRRKQNGSQETRIFDIFICKLHIVSDQDKPTKLEKVRDKLLETGFLTEVQAIRTLREKRFTVVSQSPYIDPITNKKRGNHRSKLANLTVICRM